MAGTQAEVVELRIYPIKSCHGVRLTEANLTLQGLNLDRRWMFVRDKAPYEFLTIRQNPRMTLIDTAVDLEAGTLTISLRPDPATPAITVPIDPDAAYLKSHTEELTVEIWEAPTSAYAYTDAQITSTFSKFFEEPVRLVMKSPSAPRICGGNASPSLLGRTATVNFPDVLPVLIASEASLAELNPRLRSEDPKLNRSFPLEEDITIERFRPNIIVKSCDEEGMADLEPWSEDRWKTVRIHQQDSTSSGTGKSPSTQSRQSPPPVSQQPPSSYLSTLTTLLSTYLFLLMTLLTTYLPLSTPSPPGTITIDISCRAARCHVPNCPPSSTPHSTAGVPHPKQPWETLMSYRRVDKGMKWKPCFGMLGVPRDTGRVKVGDRLEVLEAMGEGKWVGEEHMYKAGF